MPAHGSNILVDLLILFGFATLIAVLLHRARQSTIVAYLLTGMLVGPSGLRLITNRGAIELMAEVGVVLLLFTIGIEFSLKKLWRMRQVVLGAGGRQVALTVGACLAIAALMAMPWRQGLFWGFCGGQQHGDRPQLLFERQELDSPTARHRRRAAVSGPVRGADDGAHPRVHGGDDPVALAVLTALGKSLAVVALILLAAHYFFPPLWKQIVQLRNKEIFLIATIFFCLGTAWVSSLIGLSLALGAFLAGLALSESEFAHQILAEILPFRDSFNSLFFISVGMLLNLEFARENWTLVAALAATIFAVKTLTGMSAVLLLGFPARTALLVGLALAQVGEFSFVLLRQGAGLNLISSEAYQTFLAAAVVTMIITPLVIQMSPRLTTRLQEMRALRRFFPEPGEADLEAEGQPLHDHVVVCGYGLNGRLTAGVLRRLRIPYLVLETNPETVQVAQTLDEHIYFGDGSSREMLVKAGAGHARAVVFAISDPFVLGRAVANARSLSSTLHIIVRTKRLEDSPELERAGASLVIAEELEAAQEIIIRLLELYNIPRREAFAQVQASGTENEKE
jgi:CPA2 family monovalent cation:H+ antiporter-2